MPRGDGTGPAGYGPMTGRGGGYCTGCNVPGYFAGFGSFGRGFGGRGGRGRRMHRHFAYMRGKPLYHHPFAGIPYADEKEYLQKQAEFLSGRLQKIKDRLDELEKIEKEED